MKAEIVKRANGSIRYVLIKHNGIDYKVEDSGDGETLQLNSDGFASLSITPMYSNQILFKGIEK